MVLYSPDWTNIIGFYFILLTVNLFRHSTLIEHGLYNSRATKKTRLIVDPPEVETGLYL